MKRIIILTVAILLTGAGCLGPKEPGVIYLPDRIEDVTAETLPRALKEARERGKSSVTTEDPNGNIVRADISSVTHTTFAFTYPEGLEDPFAILTENQVDVSRAYDKKREGDLQLFTLNVVNTRDLASYMYEISVRIHEIQNTSDWIITIE